MSLLPVAASSLHRQRVRLRDVPLDQASVFPYFDHEGQTRALMLVWPPAPEIVVLEHRSDLARARWSGEIDIDVDFAALLDAPSDRIAAIAGLWHYDPWWVLAEPRFEGHPSVPVLKATNCVDVFSRPVYGCFFTRDLSRLVGVATSSRSSTGLSAIARSSMLFRPELLPPPERPAPNLPGRSSKEWRLDPFWQRRGWNRSHWRRRRHAL